MARPVWTPTDAQRRQAETMAAYGIPEADIARALGVSKPTLRKHCGSELDTAWRDFRVVEIRRGSALRGGGEGLGCPPRLSNGVPPPLCQFAARCPALPTLASGVRRR